MVENLGMVTLAWNRNLRLINTAKPLPGIAASGQRWISRLVGKMAAKNQRIARMTVQKERSMTEIEFKPFAGAAANLQSRALTKLS